MNEKTFSSPSDSFQFCNSNKPSLMAHKMMKCFVKVFFYDSSFATINSNAESSRYYDLL